MIVQVMPYPAVGGGTPTLGTATLTVASGTVGSDLTDYPLFIDLADMPAQFWSETNEGRDLRAKVGGSDVPIDLIYCDTHNQRGQAFVKATIASASDTDIELSWDGVSDRLDVTDTNGRDAVWSDYESVVTFGVSLEDRTGKRRSVESQGDSYSFAMSSLHTFTQDPHQGLAFDHATNSWYAIDTNAIYKFNEDFTTLQVSNLDPCGDANTLTGETTLDHLCDGCVANGYLVVPVNDYGTRGTNNIKGYILRFDLATLALVDAFDISAIRPQISGICWNSVSNRYVGVYWNAMTELDLFTTSFTSAGSITITNFGVNFDNCQGIEFYQDAYWLQRESADETYRVDLDGRAQISGLFGFPIGGNYEGLCHYKGKLAFLTDPSGSNSTVRLADPVRDNKFAGQAFYPFDGVNGWAEQSVGSLGTTWTMGASYKLDVAFQSAILTYRDASSGATNDRASLVIDDGDKVGMWDNVNSWIYASPSINPGTTNPHRIVGVYEGTTRRLFHDGAQVNSGSITPRDADFDMLTYGTDDDSRNDILRGLVGFAYLRGDALSADWLAAEWDNLNSPSTFYAIV